MNGRALGVMIAVVAALGAVVGTQMLAGASVSTSPPPVSAVTVTSGSVAVTSAPPVTGSVAVTSAPPVTGSVAVTSAPPVTGSVDVTTLPPVDIASSVRPDVSATTPPGTWLAVANDETGTRLQVDVPGTVTLAGTPNVAVTNVPTVGLANGTVVSLTSPSLAALTTATSKGQCTYVEGNPLATLGSTATNIPSSAMASRTAVTITNGSTGAKRIHCVPGGTASATAGRPIYSGGATAKWEGAQQGWVLSCICVEGGIVSTGCIYHVEEERCYQ